MSGSTGLNGPVKLGSTPPIKRYIMKYILLSIMLPLAIPLYAEELAGKPRVVDADTLAFGEERVRIEGIDAPELKQLCERESGERYSCGQVATEALRAQIGNNSITCKGESRDKYRRLIGFCFFTDGTDLNAWIVRNGHALAYRKYSTLYVKKEEEAQAENIGIWQGRFIAPWDWRKGVRLEETEK